MVKFFTIIMIHPTDNKKKVDTLFGHESRARHLHRTLALEHETKNGKKTVTHDEIFTINH